MKEQIGYVRWVVSKFDIWQWLLVFSLIFNVSSFVALGTDVSRNMNLVGMSLLFVVFFKWFVWDMVKISWSNYKEHRNTLLTTIKDSDK